MKDVCQVIIELENRIKLLSKEVDDLVFSDVDRSSIEYIFTPQEKGRMDYLAEMGNLLEWMKESVPLGGDKKITLTIIIDENNVPNCEFKTESEQNLKLKLNNYDCSDKNYSLGERYWNSLNPKESFIIFDRGLSKIRNFILTM